MNLCLAQRGVNKGKRTEKSTEKSTCLNYFSKNIFRLYLNILIDLSSESERNSVFKHIVKFQQKMFQIEISQNYRIKFRDKIHQSKANSILYAILAVEKRICKSSKLEGVDLAIADRFYCSLPSSVL